MRASDLPGVKENCRKAAFTGCSRPHSISASPWEMRPGDPGQIKTDPEREPSELLAAAGMDAETAKNWFTGYIYRNRDRDIAGDNMDIIRIELFGGYKLHGQEVILGAFSQEGAEIRPVKEDVFGEHQILEVQMLHASGAVDNHLFLFHPEKYYLLHISGNGIYYDFPVLEQIGQKIEVAGTSLYVDSYEDKINFILADLAAG